VLDLKRLDLAMVKLKWSVVLERTVRELQGTECIGLDHDLHPGRRSPAPAASAVRFKPWTGFRRL
jgi:hypothetical protein